MQKLKTNSVEFKIEIQPNSTVFSGNLSVINVFVKNKKKTHSSIFASWNGTALSKSINNPALRRMLCVASPPVCVCNM